jgi:hypothetical protein
MADMIPRFNKPTTVSQRTGYVLIPSITKSKTLCWGVLVGFLPCQACICWNNIALGDLWSRFVILVSEYFAVEVTKAPFFGAWSIPQLEVKRSWLMYRFSALSASGCAE